MVLKKKLGPGRHLSAIKRQRQNLKRNTKNTSAKSKLRTEVKKVRANPNSETLKKTVSVINKTASRGVIPKRRASRMVSRLTKMTNRAS